VNKEYAESIIKQYLEMEKEKWEILKMMQKH
jgi:hypothetical protein